METIMLTGWCLCGFYRRTDPPRFRTTSTTFKPSGDVGKATFHPPTAWMMLSSMHSFATGSIE